MMVCPRVEKRERGPVSQTCVVVLRLTYADDDACLYEIYRGDGAECDRIADSLSLMSSVYFENRAVPRCDGAEVKVDTLECWNAFLRSVGAEVST
jgi:hypothetical protein